MLGEKKSNWTIVEEIGNSKKGKLWKCRCDCGHEAIKDTGYLNYVGKHKRYKGCRQCQQGKRNQEHDDLLNGLVGKTFGSWTVVAFVGKNRYNSRSWLCRCRCGSERTFLTSYLSGNGKRKATKCKKCELRDFELNNRTTENIPDRFWNKFLHTALKRNIIVSITKEQAFDKYRKQDGRCNLSGLPLYFTKLTSRYWRYTNASIDRIDSTKPYALDNIQWLEKRINMMKQAYSQHEFVALCKLVAKTELRD